MFFRHILREYRKFGADEGSDFKTAAIVVSNDGELFIACNTPTSGDFFKECAERKCISHISVSKKQKIGSDDTDKLIIKELHLLAASDNSHEPHNCPCGLCGDTLKKVCDDKTRFIIYPACAIDENAELEIGRSFKDKKDNQIIITGSNEIIPSPFITLNDEAKSVYKSEVEKLKTGNVSNNFNLINFISDVFNFAKQKFSGKENVPELGKNPSLKKINKFLSDELIKSIKSKGEFSDVSHAYATVIEYSDGTFGYGVQLSGKKYKANLDSTTTAILSNDHLNKNPIKIVVMELNPDNAEKGRMGVSYHGMERTFKRVKPNLQGYRDLDIVMIPFNLGLSEKEVTEISVRKKIKDFFPNLFYGDEKQNIRS